MPDEITGGAAGTADYGRQNPHAKLETENWKLGELVKLESRNWVNWANWANWATVARRGAAGTARSLYA